MKATFFLVLAAAGAVVCPATAGPLNKNLIPADAKWVMHLDADACHASTLGRHIIAQRDNPAFRGFDEVKREMGIDLLTDLHGVTVFGGSNDPENAVLLLVTSAVVDDVVRKHLETGKGLSTIETDLGPVLTWTHDDKTGYGQVRRGTNESERYVFLTGDKDRLLNSIRVATGDGANAASSGTLPGSPSAGSILYFDAPDVAGMIPEHFGKGPGAFFSKVTGVRFDMGESDGDLFAEMVCSTGASEDANNILQAGQGFIALGKLLGRGEPEAAEFVKLLDLFEMTAQEKQVRVSCRYSAAKMVQMIEQDQARSRKDAPQTGEVR